MKDKKIDNVENLKITSLENSETEIEGEISADYFSKAYNETLKRIAKDVEISGFRKGKAPENLVVQNIGETKILEEAAQDVLSEVYPKILIENKVDAIGQPQITITKMALGNPLGFKIKTATMPEVEIAPYKEIAKKEMAKKEEEVEVTDKEVEEVVLQVRKNRAQVGSEEAGTPTDIPEKDLPELTDEFVKSLGDFKNVSDFKEKIKENIEQEKKIREKEKKRLAIIESIIKDSKISLPEIIVEGELQKMLSQFKHDVERSGIKYEDYLSQVKKTENDLRKEWREGAEKRAKFQLILNKIALDEKIIPDSKEVEAEVNQITQTMPGADLERVRIYVETHKTNEKVFQFLESQK